MPRGTALVTGVGRARGIGAGIATHLAEQGWDLALGYLSDYDDRIGLAHGPHDPHDVAERCREFGVTVELLPADLADPASKGALDRIVIAAAIELAERGISANAINPGPIDTGWMDDELREVLIRQTPAGRLGTPQDTADLVGFLLSPAGGWITGQLLHSNGGFAAK